VAVILGRSTPNPWVGTPIELSGRDTRGLLHLISVGKTLSWKPHHVERGATSLPVGSTVPRPFRNEDVVESRMLSHPGAGLGTAVTGEVVGDHIDIARGVIGFDVRKERDGLLGLKCAKLTWSAR
jgi:hypothetical protein